MPASTRDVWKETSVTATWLERVNISARVGRLGPGERGRVLDVMRDLTGAGLSGVAEAALMALT